MADKARVAAQARRTLAALLDGTNDPPPGLIEDDWRQARWDELCDAIGEDPQTWFEVSLAFIERTPWKELGPFRAVLAVGGERIEAEAARNRRFRVALGSVWPGGETIPPETYRRIRIAAGTA